MNVAVNMRASLIVAVVYAISACGSPLDHRDFAVGMTRSDVRERFGDPLRTTEMRKSNDSVWGPIEDFWSNVPADSTVEIWFYRTRHEWAEGGGSRETGTTELYFIDGAGNVAGLGFAPDGVVYEAAEPPRSR